MLLNRYESRRRFYCSWSPFVIMEWNPSELVHLPLLAYGVHQRRCVFQVEMVATNLSIYLSSTRLPYRRHLHFCGSVVARISRPMYHRKNESSNYALFSRCVFVCVGFPLRFFPPMGNHLLLGWLLGFNSLFLGCAKHIMLIALFFTISIETSALVRSTRASRGVGSAPGFRRPCAAAVVATTGLVGTGNTSSMVSVISLLLFLLLRLFLGEYFC
jgi:hypothetical protein